MASAYGSARKNIEEQLTSVDQALCFDHDCQQLQHYYEKWSADYDKDVLQQSYCGPTTIVRLFELLIAASEHLACQDYSSLHVMDACCGTGLVGAELARQGFGHVDGCDLSPAMVREAQKTAAYEALHAGIDLTIANASLFPDHLYDATLCCGAFIEGHLPARALDELIRITAPHGLVIFSTRRTFYEKEGFADLLDQWVANGELRPAGAIMDASYLDGVAAHYLAYSVCPH